MSKRISFFFLAVCILTGACKRAETTSDSTAKQYAAVNYHDLEQLVFNYNNEFKYDSSRIVTQKFLDQKNGTNDDKYKGFLVLSYIHKRLFNYDRVFACLDSAMKYASNAKNKGPAIANINAQKALAMFDIHKYKESARVMNQLASTGYRYLNEEYQAKIIMQEGYLLYLKREYEQAQSRYSIAVQLMEKGSPCDLPMIYAKQIELFGAMKDEKSMLQSYQKSIQRADSCGIEKYRLYTLEMMKKTYAELKDYHSAFRYFTEYDSVNRAYNEKSHLDKIEELDRKFQSEKKENELLTNRAEIKKQQVWIVVLILTLLIIIASFYANYINQQKKQLLKINKQAKKFTDELFMNSERERKRIATDLHDGISHELLALKKAESSNGSLNNKIDEIINEVRNISRDLHPVLFDKVGLKLSLEQMLERIGHDREFMVTLDYSSNHRLPATSELQLYRIIQEALSNTVKYANAVAAKITISETHEDISIEVKDNGKGFKVEKTLNSEKSFGLHNIIERGKSIGGKVMIQSSRKGTIITIKIVKK